MISGNVLTLRLYKLLIESILLRHDGVLSEFTGLVGNSCALFCIHHRRPCLWHAARLHQTWKLAIKVCASLNALNITLGGPGSSVGIATGYVLDGPGIESRWGWDFLHLSRLAVGLTQLPVQYNGYRVFPSGRKQPGHDNPSPPSSAEV
jgi:hypothetical protein